MIYECDYCHEQVGPNASSCPRCGQEFDDLVPADAAPPPERPWPGRPKAAAQTIILSAGRLPPASPPRLSLLQSLFQKTWALIFGRPPRVL